MSQSIPDDVVLESEPHVRTPAVAYLVSGAVIVAALYFGRELLMPLVLAGLLAFVLAPACALLRHIRIPRVVSVLIVVALAFAAIGGIGLVVGRQIGSLAGNLPSYQSTVMDKWHALSTGGGLTQRLLQGAVEPKGSSTGPAGAKAPTATEAASALGIQNASGLAIARTLATPLLAPLTTAGVVLVFTIFILLSNEDLRDRLVRLVGRHDLHRTILAMNDAARRLSRYFLFQLGLNSSFGVLIGACLWWAGLPNPILWGILAALMRFVPFIGIFIALLPPLLLAVAVVPGWTLALTVLALFIGTEMVMGQVIEPLIYGHSTGLSPIAVIVATAFWAFMWGPVGLLLATPLTVCLVVIGRHVQPLAFFDVILGDTPPLEPSETFYQRALEGHASDLTPGARAQIAATSRADYYDKVALRGLALAQRDLARDALAFERLDAIHVQIAGLLEELDGVVPTSDPATSLPVDWQTTGAVVCIPGRGQLDDLAATMAVQVLRSAGYGVSMEPNLVLGSSDTENVDLANARLCCLSVLEDGSTASGIRYFVRRMQKKMPSAKIVICLWQAPADSALLADLRSTGEDEHLVLSIGELMALIQALSALKMSFLQKNPGL
jgi:predicted PurR-regulated permease PerM